MHNAFVQAQFQTVADFDTTSFSPSNSLPAQILKYRAQIALGQSDSVLSSLKSSSSSPDLAAISLLATYCKAPSTESPAVKNAAELAAKAPTNLTVQLCCGTVLAAAGHHEEALAVLAKHEGSLDCVALIVQIQLAMNRVDLARRECNNAKKWAQDSLLVNIAESWVALREVCFVFMFSIAVEIWWDTGANE
jgi:coatomer subunit epsilon